MKVVINRRFGGFGLSSKAVELYSKLSGIPIYRYGSDFDGNLKQVSFRGKENTDITVYFTKAGLTKWPKGKNTGYFDTGRSMKRDDPILIKVVEKLGARADGEFAKLTIVEIPDDVEWEISEYDGNETVEEKHGSWY